MSILIEKNYGDVRIYKALLTMMNEDTADEFMLSSDGGYSQEQLDQIKYEIKRRKKRYLNNTLPTNNRESI